MSACLESPPQAASRETVQTHRRRELLVVGVPLLFAHLPLLVLHAGELWRRPHYQFFPLVILGAIGLAARSTRGLGQNGTGSPPWSRALFMVSWSLLAYAVVIASPWLGAVAALSSLLAVAYDAGGPAYLRDILPTWALLWVIMPIPLGLDGRLTDLLQRGTSGWSSAVLDVLGVFHVMEGNVVRVVGRRLLVERACSGINSLFVVLACTVFLIAMCRRSILRGVFLLLASVVWVLVGNTARVVTVAALVAWWEFDLSGGSRHEALGFLVFLTTLGLVVSTDRLLLILENCIRRLRFDAAAWRIRRSRGLAYEMVWNRRPEDRMAPNPPPVPATTPAAPVHSSRDRDRPTTILYRLRVRVAGDDPGGATLPGPRPVALPDASVRTFVRTLQADTLPTQRGGFRRKGFKVAYRDHATAENESSRVWYYAWRGHDVAVSIDYPFCGWHELTSCYRNLGWLSEHRTVHGGSAGAGSIIEESFRKSEGRFGYLLFSVFDRRGQSLEHLAEPGPVGAVDRPPKDAARPSEPAGWRTVPAPERRRQLQFQLFLECEQPLNERERREAFDFFRVVERTLRDASREAR